MAYREIGNRLLVRTIRGGKIVPVKPPRPGRAEVVVRSQRMQGRISPAGSSRAEATAAEQKIDLDAPQPSSPGRAC